MRQFLNALREMKRKINAKKAMKAKARKAAVRKFSKPKKKTAHKK
jgi:hypothetical protein